MKTYLSQILCRLIISSVLAFGLTSCGGAPVTTTDSSSITHEFEIRITTATDVNPDVESRPSPIVLHVLQLARDDKFLRAEYFALARDDASSLGSDVLDVTEIVLKPGDSRVKVLELHQQTAYLGFVAGYRDIEHARWRISQRVLPGDSDWISVQLGEKHISIIEANE